MIFLLPALLTAAAPLQLALPVQCDIGKSCFVQNYMDHDSGPGWKDYGCGPMTYDGHTGTDIRVADRAAMEKGVPVLAALAGKVRGVRDGEPDSGVTGKDDISVKGKECGNGVVLVHADGYETQYCHLKNGSARVKVGDDVQAGAVLGEIGKSGAAQFPHVHFEVRKDGKPIDPFTATGLEKGCDANPEQRLWNLEAAQALRYAHVSVLNAGFTDTPPSAGNAEPVAVSRLAKGSAAIIFWVDLIGIRQGDRLAMTLLAPDGKIVAEHKTTYDRNKATVRQFIGKKNRGTLASGIYSGTYEVIHPQAGKEISMLKRSVTVQVE